MSKRIYVGNLPFSFTDEDLETLFSKYGKVTQAAVVTDKYANNQSKGFGFVEMEKDEEAMAAMEDAKEDGTGGLNGSTQGGRPLKVNEARPREERPARDNNRGGGDRGNYSMNA